MSNIHMLHEHTQSVHLLDAQEIAIAGNEDGVSVDCTGWDKLSVQINVGAIGAGGTLTVIAQEGAVPAPIAGAQVVVAAADDQATYEMDIDLRELASKIITMNAAAAVGSAVVAISGRLYRGNVMLPPVPENTVVTV